VKRRTSAALALAAIAATAATVVLVATSDVLATPVSSAIVRGATVAAWTLCGLRTWERRPGSPLGALMVSGGFAYGLGSLNALDAPVAFTLGSLFWPVAALLVTYIALAFPSGRPTDRASRVAAVGLAGASATLWGLLLLGAARMPTPARPFRCAHDCPSNPFELLGLSNVAATAVERAAFGAFGLSACVAIAVLILRLRATSPAGRRILLPPTLSLCAIAASFVLALVVGRTAGDDGLAGATGWLPPVASIAFPFVLLLGQARGRLFAAGSLRDMVSRLSAASARRDLEAVMADALGDPSLRLAFPLAQGGFVDGAGAPIAVPGEPPAAVTEVRDQRGLMAAILHDPVLDEPSRGVVRAAGAAIMLALENARLEADVRASARALHESRARVLTAAVSERRRLERNLHDTAQQRLVALRIKFALARERVGSDAGAIGPLLEQLGADVEATIDSIRVVGRGLYPPLLADRGLGVALTSVLAKAPTQLSLSVGSLGRSDPDVEAAVYLCCRSVIGLLAEQVAADARLTLDVQGRDLCIAVICKHAAAPGDLDAQVLTQLRDHVGTLDGWVDKTKDANGGWRINAAVPWPPRTPTRASA
jgi:signal transduction histidine kinase